MFEQIPLSAPCLGASEWKYVKDCLETGWVSSAGGYVEMFEEAVCRYTGARYAVACINGTAALHTALMVCGVRPGDEVIAPSITFIAPINAIRYAGAEPVFMDCDEYFNIDAKKTTEFIVTHTRFSGRATYNVLTGRRIGALVPVHVFGNAADLEDLALLCRKRRIPVVEDATEALGTWYIRPGGAGKKHAGLIGQAGCLSFNGNKIITTGAGGMIITDSPALARRARYLTTQAKDDPTYYIHDEVGYNYRMSNLSAALGVAQMEKLSTYLEKKKANYELYRDLLAGVEGMRLAPVPPYAQNNLWMYALTLEGPFPARERDRIMERLRAKGVETRPLWYPNHLQKPYRRCRTYRIERAENVWRSTLNLPCSVDLTPEAVSLVVKELKDA
ncbi:MAG: LegC family aminotransferase [Desulfomonilia bacterium]|jgi:perosamine synthetase